RAYRRQEAASTREVRLATGVGGGSDSRPRSGESVLDGPRELDRAGPCGLRPDLSGEHRGPSPPGERDRSVHQVQDVRAGELYFRVCSTDLEGPDPPRELPDRHVAKVRVDHTGV